MPTTIRHSTFETNSSSVHALVCFTPDQEALFTDNGYYLFFPMQEMIDDQNLYAAAYRIASEGEDWFSVPEIECLEYLQDQAFDITVVNSPADLPERTHAALVHPDAIYDLIPEDNWARDEIDRMISGLPGGWSIEADVEGAYADAEAFTAKCGIVFENVGTENGKNLYHVSYRY